MRIRNGLALLLLLPAAASAQDLDTARSALVRISGTREGTTVRGSGFVVSLDRDKATIVTASHVIEGVLQIEVTFAVDPGERYQIPTDAILGMDAGSLHGLAVFQVRGALPAEVTTLSFEIDSRPRLGEALFLLGFPQMSPTPRTTQRVLSARSGTLLLIDQGVGEGFSGGPLLLQGGKLVGVITDTDDLTTYAISALVAREALEGWGVKLGGRSTENALPLQPEPCVPGQKRLENDIVFVRICPGTFAMGSAESDPLAAENEKPAHQVTLGEFWIAETEITNQQYRSFRPDHQGEARLPLTGVSWHEADAACQHFGGRLPSEAEWEYAARAGSQTAWSFGDDGKRLGEYAWYGEKPRLEPYPVGTKKPNAWGLYDLHGNVFEWVADWYGTYPHEAQIDPKGPGSGRGRSLRGGSFADIATTLRSAFRGVNPPENRSRYIGFRCISDPRRQPSSPAVPGTLTSIQPATPALETCAPGEERTEAGIVFIRICPGTFTMGSTENDPRASENEKPAHQVTLGEFWIGKTEITNEQYRGLRPDHQGSVSIGLPATFVSWADAKKACEHFGGRLPTEAEWEYAARAGTQTTWSFGDDEAIFGEFGWHVGNASAYVAQRVGMKKPNAWGLYDVHGNVWEWVADWYSPSYPRGPQTDPTGPKTGKERVLRGGAFSGLPKFLRSAVRLGNEPKERSPFIGFRCVLSPGRRP